MRKHFLLLFLMALLPLAGWAADLGTAVVNLNRTSLDYVGTGSNVPVIQSVTVGGEAVAAANYSVAYKKVTGTTTADIELAAIKDAGSYQLILTPSEAGATAGYTGSKTVAFSISKRHLIMTLNEQAATKVYGESDPTTLDYTWTNASEIQYPDNVNNLQLTWTLEREEGEDVDTYAYTTASVTATNYDITIEGAAEATLEITKAPLSITYTGVLKKIYGAADPALPKLNAKEGNAYVYTIVGLKGTDTQESLFANQEVAYTAEEQDANYTPAWVVIDGENLNYIDVTEITRQNYEISFANIELKIAQAKFNATTAGDGYSFALSSATTQSQVYDAKSLAPSVTLVYTTSDNGTITVPADDINLTYATEDGDENHKTVGTYTVTVNAAADGNYANALAQTITFDITKRTIYSFIDVDNKVYNGQAISADDVEISLSNVAQNDKTGDNAITADIFTFEYNEGEGLGATPFIAVADYEIQPKLNTGVGGASETVQNLLTKNYTINHSTAQFSITARPVMITAAAQSIVFGNNIKQTSADPVFNAYTIGEVEGEDVSGLVGEDNLGTITVALAEDLANYTVQEAAYTGAILVNVAEANENYDIRTTAGDLTVTGASFTLIAKPVTVTYDGTTGYTTKFGFTTSGINKNLIDATKVTYEVWDYAQTQKLDAYPTDADEYKIVPVLDPTAIPDNYSAPSTIAGDLTIEQLALTITAGAIEINNGATPADLNALGNGKVLFKDAENNEYDIPYVLEFTEGNTDADGNLSHENEEVLNNGYKVVADEDEDYTNYSIAWNVTGNLNVFVNTLILDRTSEDLLTKLAAVDEGAYKVKFMNNRTLRAGEWNMMVLPFATDVPTISAAMKARKSTWTQENPQYETGYAIVNVLNSATTSSNIRFELTMGQIAANTPFLIKTAGDVVLDDVEFAGVTIDAPEGAEVTGPTYNDVTFKGIYATKADLEEGEMTIKRTTWYYGKRSDANLRAFEAYLTGVTVGARIFIEDFENGTTAIKELGVDGTAKAYAIDGWYTLNGVKLNAAPTEKGVYINNGKKVVVK